MMMNNTHKAVVTSKYKLNIGERFNEFVSLLVTYILTRGIGKSSLSDEKI